MSLNIIGNQIQIPFAINQEVWHAQSSQHPQYITCPDCLGEKVLTVLQGNGAQFTIECATCRVGYEPSRGTIQTRAYQVLPMPFKCARVELNGNKFCYYDPYNSGTFCDRLFATKLECEKKCQELNEEYAKEEDRRLISNLESKRRDMAWSVSYWQRKVKDLEKDLNAARARLSVCKQKEQS